MEIAGDTMEKKRISVIVENLGKKIYCEAGGALLDTLRENGIRINAACNGMGRCGKCRVKILGGAPPATPADRDFLSDREIAEGLRLACALHPAGDLRIRVESLQEDRIDSVARDRHQGEASWHPGVPLGIAVDIGTTTLAACIHGRDDGRIYASASAVNSGRDFGADVMSRMEAARGGKGTRLREMLRGDVANLLSGLVERAHVSPGRIEKIVIAANMPMVHLLMGYPVDTMIRAPFTPANPRMIEGDSMRILGMCGYSCPVVVLPALSAFIGGDIVSGMMASGMHLKRGTALLLDAGTNGEMALCHGGRIYAASAAAGPAFEGAGVSCGCASIPGAVCGVRLSLKKGMALSDPGSLETEIRTIGSGYPIGICGSGVLALASELLRVGAVDSTGLYAPCYRENGFLLAGNAGLRFTQTDIRALQLAKAAIRAGLDTMLSQAGCLAEDVEEVYLAGGFGTRMDPEAAIRIGMLPESFRGKVIPAGNTSLAGAVMAGGLGFNADIEKLLEDCRVITLAGNPAFEEDYIRNIDFPEIANAG